MKTAGHKLFTSDFLRQINRLSCYGPYGTASHGIAVDLDCNKCLIKVLQEWFHSQKHRHKHCSHDTQTTKTQFSSKRKTTDGVMSTALASEIAVKQPFLLKKYFVHHFACQ